MEVNTLNVIGAGTMGSGIAQVAAQAGIRVHVTDVDEAALEGGRARLDASLQGGIERGKIDEAGADDVRRLIEWRVDDATEPGWVIEAVPEDIEIKATVLRRVSEATACPIATNTSTIQISKLAKFCKRPERLVGIHFFNPVPAMKPVEVIRGEQTEETVADAAVRLCERLGKTPIIAPDIPGFIVNRAFAALVAAAIDTWDAGASAEAVDGAMEMGLAHKMGPLKSADLVGLDVMLAVMQSIYTETADARFAPPEVLARMVDEGKLGRKSGEGFYEYGK